MFMAIIQQYHKDTDTTYVYESESYWVPELGQSRSRRKCIGKIDPATGEIVPCGKRGRKKKEIDTSVGYVEQAVYDKLEEKYTLSQQEVTRLELALSEANKKLALAQKENQRLALTLKRIQSLISEM